MMALIFASFVPALLADRYRYTWCLLVFALPGTVALVWALYRTTRARSWFKAWALGLALLLPLGWGLGLLLGGALFTYRAPAQVLGYDVLAPLPTGGTAPVPIEEFGFYLLGFAFICAQYLWGCCIFTPRWPKGPAHRIALPLWIPAIWVIAAGSLILLLRGPPRPIYALFLFATNAPLLIWGFSVARYHLQWKPLAWTMFSTVALSVVWEPVLALPQGWWGYRSEWLLGWYVSPGLPIEAVMVWFLAPLTSGLVVTVLAMRGGLLTETTSPNRRLGKITLEIRQ
jgi:hypothetical protein